MKKTYIEGINGSIEVNSKYVFVVIGNREKRLLEEHVVWFEEIEDVIYKKPTKETYGLITIYLSTKSFLLNKKISYTIILDKVNEKDLEANKKIYNVIKSIVDNNQDIKVKESIDEEIKEDIIKETEQEEHEIKQVVDVIESHIKDNKKEEPIFINNLKLEQENVKEIGTVPMVSKSDEELNIKDTIVKLPISEITPVDYSIEQEEIIEEDSILIPVSYEEIEENSDDLEQEDLDEIEEVEKTIEDQETKVQIESIGELEDKIEELEKELKTISFKETILNKYVDEAKEKNKIEKLIIELKKIIEKLEKIKKEIKKQENKISDKDFIKIEEGNILITSANKYLLNNEKDQYNSYLSQYESTSKRLEEIVKETKELSDNAEEKRKAIKLSDEEFDKDVNLLKGVKTTKDFIEKYRKEAAEDLARIKKEISTKIEKHTKYKYVKRGITEQTKRLAALTALNAIRPGRSRFSVIATCFLTGTSSISDLLGYDLKKVEYSELVSTETLTGVDLVDTELAKRLIEDSKKQIDYILEDCEKKYGEYPKFKELKRELIKVKKEIEKEESLIKGIDESLDYYKSQPRVKTLRYSQDKKEVV